MTLGKRKFSRSVFRLDDTENFREHMPRRLFFIPQAQSVPVQRNCRFVITFEAPEVSYRRQASHRQFFPPSEYMKTRMFD